MADGSDKPNGGDELPPKPPMRDEKGRWLPGSNGNPFGRPRGPSFMELLERELDRKHGKGLDAKTKREKLAELLVRRALENQPQAIDLLIRRLAPEKVSIEHTGALMVQVDRIEAEAEKLDQLLERHTPEQVRELLH
jgi:hypothetical protein